MDTKELFSVAGKTAVITGGSRGIGKWTAEAFVRSGARVYITSRKAEACEETAAELAPHGECIPLPADLGKPEEVERFANEMASREERIHVLMNNAGTYWSEAFAEYSIEGFQKVVDVNLLSPFHLAQKLLPQLKAAATDDDWARVINVASVDGIRAPMIETYAYSSTKAALIQLTKHMARFLANEKIAVNAIAPGLFRTKMSSFFFEAGVEFAQAGIPMARDGRPEEIAGTALFLASKAAGYMTGSVVVVDGGVTI